MTDLIPAPRPIPTREDRMQPPRNDRTFATYLDRHERDELDAKVGCLQDELNDALDDLTQARAEITALRTLTGRLEGDNAAMMRDRDQALAERDRARAIADAATYQYGDMWCIDGECDHEPTNGQCPFVETRYATAATILAIQALTMSTDGDALDDAEEIPVGEIRRVLAETQMTVVPADLGSPRRAQDQPVCKCPAELCRCPAEEPR